MLNLGVSPAKLIDLMRAKLVAAGGVLLEKTGVSGGNMAARCGSGTHPHGIIMRMALAAARAGCIATVQ